MARVLVSVCCLLREQARASKPMSAASDDACLGGQWQGEPALQYIEDLLAAYPGVSKLALQVLPGYIDDASLLRFLRAVEHSHPNTVIALASSRGPVRGQCPVLSAVPGVGRSLRDGRRMTPPPAPRTDTHTPRTHTTHTHTRPCPSKGHVAEFTHQGYQESLLPALWMVFPTQWLHAHPHAHRALRANAGLLVTPRDFLLTLHHLAVYHTGTGSEPVDPPQLAAPTERHTTVMRHAKSLLAASVGRQRTCEAAGVAAQHCLCSEWFPATRNYKGLAEAVVGYLNDAVRKHGEADPLSSCRELRLGNIISVEQLRRSRLQMRRGPLLAARRYRLLLELRASAEVPLQRIRVQVVDFTWRYERDAASPGTETERHIYHIASLTRLSPWLMFADCVGGTPAGGADQVDVPEVIEPLDYCVCPVGESQENFEEKVFGVGARVCA